MINATGLEVILKLDDQLTAGFNKSFDSIKKNIDSVGTSMAQLGRQITSLGRNMTFLGAAITGPMALAFKTTSDYSIEASDALKRMGNSAIELQMIIGTAMIPVVEKITRKIEELTKWFKQLDPHVRTAVIQGALMTGMFLLLGGTILHVVGSITAIIGRIIVFTAAGIAINPVMLAIVLALAAIAGTIAVVVTHMDKIQQGAKGLYDFFDNLKTKISDTFPVLKEFGEWIDKLREKGIFEKATAAAKEMSIDSVLGMFGIPKGVFDMIKSYFQTERIDLGELVITQSGTSKIDAWLADFKQKFGKAFTDAYKAAMDLGTQSAQILTQSISTFSTGFGNAVANMLVKGKNFGESMKEVFQNLAVTFISSIVSMIAQWLIYQAIQIAFMPLMVSIASATASALAVIWAPVAALVSLATMGANAGPAMAAITATTAWAGFGGGASGGAGWGGGFAEGGSGVVDRPTLFLAGEAGPERFSFTPMNKRESGRGGVTVYMENAYFNTADAAEETLARLSRLMDENKRSRIR